MTQRDQGQKLADTDGPRPAGLDSPVLPGSRLDFRRISNHLNRKQPGYYLILLRNELRHRSLREKLGWEDLE